MSSTRPLFLVVITLMGSVGLLATDIYLPALPEMADYFTCAQTEIQTSFTLFLLGLACCQLVYGILADRYGRKKVTLLGLSLFIIASFLCALSQTLPQFLFFRLLQAMGGGVGSVVNRAIVAAHFNKIEATKIFSTIFPIIGLSAAIGPWIGGYLTSLWGWRSTFYFMVGFGIVVWVLVFFFLKESKKSGEALDADHNRDPENTLHPHAQTHPTPPHTLSLSKHFLGYLRVLRNLNFLGYALIICAAFSSFRCFSVESPFVFHNQGYTADEIGTFYFALSVAYVVGNLTAKRLVSSISVERVMNLGFMFLVLGAACMIVSSVYFGTNPYSVILPMAIVVLGNGFLFPTGSAGAMSSVAVSYSGRASGLLGALQFTSAAFCIHWIGGICQGHPVTLSIFIGSIIFLGLLCYRFLVQKPKRVLGAAEH